MIKKDFVKALAVKMGVTQKKAAEAFDGVMDQLIATIATGDEFTIVGFGKFFSEDKPARTARNPKTGEPVEVPEKRVPKFKYSAKFRKVVFGDESVTLGKRTRTLTEEELDEDDELATDEGDSVFDAKAGVPVEDVKEDVVVNLTEAVKSVEAQYDEDLEKLLEDDDDDEAVDDYLVNDDPDKVVVDGVDLSAFDDED